MSLPVHLVDSADSGDALADAGPGTSVTLEGDEAHHAVAVRRMRVGERLVLTDGAGTSVTAEVAATGKRLLTATVHEVRRVPEPAPAIVVVQALPKGDRGELAVEMLTEVGVARVVPWAASRSVAVWKGERATKSLARWRATAREAAKQARRSWFPVVDELASTADVVALLADAPLAVVLHEEASVPLASLDLPAEGPLVIVVGPEGGLTDEEVAAFVAAGAASVRLGAEVLRTSTAGVAATAALLSRTPRWS
ncbi:16S rRNA (uracil(1498)-N(3))-methyltransferase [Nocardioides sp. zg-DK7169]|uniref:16S rRNA (uracil(1498)-N(3))-methyltransferase n=1 Tax=Nocardioides sp. zg-DK7169 TaxID=2736600 RepID=UPI001552D01A|nr:16S rRNA (uracil(1498)-N(3))-methyltransferase [Nocardioides sp. zg-DK7169]NPC98360.1 16S rRNA (uracil(1498)-N(3))-methyltransferase [Nocardioides sp. zg-DK7169]